MQNNRGNDSKEGGVAKCTEKEFEILRHQGKANRKMRAKNVLFLHVRYASCGYICR